MRYVAQVNAARSEVGRNQHFKAAFLEIEHCISRDPPAISPVGRFVLDRRDRQQPYDHSHCD
jgi:hypothetical protein